MHKQPPWFWIIVWFLPFAAHAQDIFTRTAYSRGNPALLREDLLNLMIGALLLALGLAVLVLFVSRRGRTYQSLLFFGLFCTTYGFRLCAYSELIRVAFPLPTQVYQYLVVFTTYFILIPFGFLVQYYFGVGWRSSLRIMLWLQGVYSVSAIVIDSFYAPETAMAPNNFLAILWLVVITANGLHLLAQQSAPLAQETRIMFAGAIFFALTALNSNLVGRQLVPWRFNIEQIGMLVFVLGLGYFIAHRYFANEHELLVVTAEHDRKAKELEEARQLQLSMLPKKLPQLPHLDIAAYMKTATEVGGDYYDFHLDDDGTLTIAVGDATGHGLKAGTMVTAVKGLFDTLASHPDIPHIFERLTRTLKRMNLRGLFMAMTVAKINHHQLVLSIAGMPPVLLYRASSQQVEVIELKALPLGGILNYRYQQLTLALAAGDVVVLMSDGLPERFNAQDEMLGYEPIHELLANVGTQTATDIIAALIQAGDDWAGARPQDDDVTFVIVKVKE